MSKKSPYDPYFELEESIPHSLNLTALYLILFFYLPTGLQILHFFRDLDYTYMHTFLSYHALLYMPSILPFSIIQIKFCGENK